MRRFLLFFAILLVPAVVFAQAATSTIGASPIQDVAKALELWDMLAVAFRKQDARLGATALLTTAVWFVRAHAPMIRKMVAKIPDEWMPAWVFGAAFGTGVLAGLQAVPQYSWRTILMTSVSVGAGAVGIHQGLKFLGATLLPWIGAKVPILAPVTDLTESLLEKAKLLKPAKQEDG